jgi:hypothetical protein
VGHLQVVPGLLDQLYRNAWGVPGEGRDYIILYYTPSTDGFGGLVGSMLASGTRVRGFKPGRSRWNLRASEKSAACLPSEGK